MTPPNMPLWHVDYFELKALKNKQTQNHLSFPLTALKNLERGTDSEKRPITRENFYLNDPSV